MRRRHHPLLAAALLAGCSTLPDAKWPPSVDHDIVAEFVVPASGEFAFPATDERRIVQSLELSPQPRGERFGAGGERWLLYPAGTRVRAHARLRTFADEHGRLPSPGELIPGATLLAPEHRP